jgi:hypothetical protein
VDLRAPQHVFQTIVVYLVHVVPFSAIAGSGDFLPPSPPAEKPATDRQQAGKASTGRWDRGRPLKSKLSAALAAGCALCLSIGGVLPLTVSPANAISFDPEAHHT